MTVKLYRPIDVGEPLRLAVVSPKVDELNPTPVGRFPDDDHASGRTPFDAAQLLENTWPMDDGPASGAQLKESA
jgi:hypothetical protein